MVKYYKFPMEKEKSVIVLSDDFRIEGYPVEIEFIDSKNLKVRIGCKNLAINNESIDILIDELKNDILNDEYIGLSSNKYDKNRPYPCIDHILSKIETSYDKEYYITTKNTRLLGKNWNQISIKTQLFKKYFKYIQQNERITCEFENSHNQIKNIPEVLEFLLALKEFLSAPEKYLMKQE